MRTRLGRPLLGFRRNFRRGFSCAFHKSSQRVHTFKHSIHPSRRNTRPFKRVHTFKNNIHSGFIHAYTTVYQATSNGFTHAYIASYQATAKNAPALRTLALTAVSFFFGFTIGQKFLPVNVTVAESPAPIITAEEKARLSDLKSEHFSLATLSSSSEDKDKTSSSTSSKSSQKTTSPSKNSPNKKSTQPKGTMKIANKTLPLRTVVNTNIESDRYVNLLSGYNFAFAHNYVLPSLSGVTTFTLNCEGKTETYKVVKSITLEKKKINMAQLVYANYADTSYDLALMTCAGRSLGGGDATHRLILFANRV